MRGGHALRDAFRVMLRVETQLSTAVDRRLRDELALPLNRFWCLEVIDKYESCRVLDIANDLSMSVGGVSKVVDRLEASGLCIRTVDPKDRRSSTIGLSRAGKSLLTDAVEVLEDEMRTQLGEAIVTAIEAEERPTMIDGASGSSGRQQDREED